MLTEIRRKSNIAASFEAEDPYKMQIENSFREMTLALYLERDGTIKNTIASTAATRIRKLLRSDDLQGSATVKDLVRLEPMLEGLEDAVILSQVSAIGNLTVAGAGDQAVISLDIKIRTTKKPPQQRVQASGRRIEVTATNEGKTDSSVPSDGKTGAAVWADKVVADRVRSRNGRSIKRPKQVRRAYRGKEFKRRISFAVTELGRHLVPFVSEILAGRTLHTIPSRSLGLAIEAVHRELDDIDRINGVISDIRMCCSAYLADGRSLASIRNQSDLGPSIPLWLLGCVLTMEGEPFRLVLEGTKNRPRLVLRSKEDGQQGDNKPVAAGTTTHLTTVSPDADQSASNQRKGRARRGFKWVSVRERDSIRRGVSWRQRVSRRSH